jgi:hypothetical protein
VGVVLCQNIAGEERVVAYAGKGFNAAESNYSTSEPPDILTIDIPVAQKPDLVKAQLGDHYCTTMLAYLTDKSLPVDNKLARVIALTADHYTITDGVLHHLLIRGNPAVDHNIQLVIPESLKATVTHECHDNLGHFAAVRTYETARTRYYWPGLNRDIHHYAKSCIQCNKRKTSRCQRKAPVTPMPLVSRPFERIACDCVGPLQVTKSGNRYLVVFSDYLTRWPEVFATKSIEATVIARLIVDEIIPRHGPPEWFLSDLGSNFLSSLAT